MKKFRKLFLSAAMLGSLCILGAGITSNADDTTPSEPTEPTLTENFSFVEEFDYGDGTIDAYGGTNNHNIYANNKQNLITPNLVKKDELEVLNINTLKDSSQNGKISFRDNATASCLYNKEGGSMVLKFKFNIDHGREQHFGIWFHVNDGIPGPENKGKTYELLRMRDNGTFYRVDGSNWVQITTLTERVAKNVWHEATFIIQDNGDLQENKSQDKIIGFLDGKFIYETNFADGDNFQGKLTEFFYNLPTSNTSADINAYMDYIRIGDYNAPVATAPVVEEIKTSVPFSLAPTISGTDSSYLPSVTPEYTVSFSLNEENLTSSTNTAGMLVFKSGDEEIIGYENGKYVGLKAVENLKATINFDSDFLAPIDVVFDIAENTEPIPVTDIATEVVIEENVLTLGVNEKFDVSKLFRATPSTADDLTLSYVVSDDSVFGLDTETGILQGVAKGTATLTVTANGATNVSKEITINVVDGPYDLLNSYEAGNSWTAETTINEKVWQGKTHNNKEFSPISAVEDDLFGTAIKFEGKGAANGGGSHLDMHVPYYKSAGADGEDYTDDDEYYLNWDKDYKLTGYVKIDATTGNTGRFAIKVYGYTPGTKNYTYWYEAPYYVALENITVNDNNGWAYFETEPFNLDYYAITTFGYTTWVTGFKIELGVWNVMEGVDLYAAHLNLVEQEDVRYAGWNLTNDDAYPNSSYDLITGLSISKNAGTTYQITALGLPSAAELNVTYTSSDETIATVDNTGLVTFLNKSGEVVITAENSDGTKKTVTFNVKNTAQSISVPEGQDKVEMSIGDTVKIVDVTVSPADATSTYTVTVADTTLCTTRFLNNKLQIVPLKVGTTTITITAEDNESATLTLTLTISGYSITYNVNGHGEEQDSVANVTSLPLELPQLTAEGWVFVGWFYDEACTQEAKNSDPIEANVTLYAKWATEAPAAFKVTYNVNGHGTAPAEVTDVTSLPATLPTLTADGWTFEGWYTDSACTTKAEAGKAITEDTVLYAKWTEKAAENPGGDEPEPTPTPKPTDPKDSGVNVAAIVVPIVVVVVLAVAGVLVYFFVFKKKEPKDKE